MTTLPSTTPVRVPQPIGMPVAYVPGSAAGAGNTFQLTGADVWRIVRANLWLIILFVIFFGIAGYLTNLLLLKRYPLYRATGFLLVETQYRPSAIGYNPMVEMSNDALTAMLRTQTALLQTDSLFASLLKKESKLRETSWYNQFMVPDNQGGLIFDASAAKKYLEDKLRVSPVSDSALLKVEFVYKVPEDTKVIVNELVDEHLRQQGQAASLKLTRQTDSLRRLEMDLGSQITTKQSAIRNRQVMLNQKGMGNVSNFNIKEVELRALVEAQLKLSGNASEARNMYERMAQQAQAGEPLSEVEKAIDQDYMIANLMRDLSGLEVRRESLTDYGPQHRDVVNVEKQIAMTRRMLNDRREELKVKYTDQMLDSLRAQAALTSADLEAMSKQVDTLKSEMAELGKEMTLLLLDQEEDKGLRELRQQVSNKMRDIVAAAQENQTRIDWAPNGRPETPDAPYFPRLIIVMPLAVMLGLGLALGIAFLRELMDETVRSPRDVGRVGQLTVLGMIADESDDPQVAGAQLAIFDAPHSITAEQFRQVRTRLQHAVALETTRSVMVTGPGPMDGKTTVAANLAAGLALNGRKILLVDANFRRPELHRLFALDNVKGFSDVLTGNGRVAELAQATKVPNLTVLTTGPKPPNATELFESELLAEFVRSVSEEYDHIIFDSGPFLMVSESTALASKVDGVITVIRAHAESRGLLQRMRDSLRQVKAEHLGVVLNGVRARHGGYYRQNIKTYYDYNA